MERGRRGPEQGPALRLTEEQQREIASKFFDLATDVRQRVNTLGVKFVNGRLTEQDIDDLQFELERTIFAQTCNIVGVRSTVQGDIIRGKDLSDDEDGAAEDQEP